MNNTYTFNTSTLARNLVGFDALFDTILKKVEEPLNFPPNNFPPYNIRKLSDTDYVIEIALAGYKRDEIDITLQENVLTVVGTKPEKSIDEFVYKGIAERNFTRKFTVMQDVEVTGADMIDGILVIDLHRHIPEEKKPRKIPVGKSEKMLLQD